MRRVRSAALALILVIALTACRGGGGQEAVARGHSYSEDTIGTFVNQCIWRPRVTAAQCACLLEKYRTDFSEKEFLELLAKPATNAKAMAFLKGINKKYLSPDAANKVTIAAGGTVEIKLSN